MLHEPDLFESREPWTSNDVQMAGSPDETSLPFDQAGFQRLAPDQQSWILEGFLCAQDVERFRLGQELHDSTGQLIVALRLSLGRIKRLGGVLESEAFFCETDLIVEQIEREMRAFSFLHCPTQLQDQGLAAALEDFARGFEQRTELQVTFQNHCRTDLGNGSAAGALLRVVQEALTNVYRHAHASSVLISLARRKGKVELCIVDDGNGLPDEAQQCRAGVGVRSMTHRMESHGGTLALQRLSQGTKVIARLPARCFELDLGGVE